MSRDRRKARRSIVRHFGVILSGDGSTRFPCMLIDVSASGARLELRAPSKVPDEFTLLLSRDAAVRRKCKVSWRSEAAVGVQFVVAQSKTTG